MRRMVLFVLLACFMATPLQAAVTMYKLHDHPNNQVAPPPYGLRLDNLLGSGRYTFSFDYADSTGMSGVMLEYNDATNEIHIFGRAYGGKDVGAVYDAVEQGWVDIDFTYRLNVIVADNANGDPGNDLYVTLNDVQNNGTVMLDGWGGNQTFNIQDKVSGNRSFRFDNDNDHKGNGTFAGDPMIWSGTGWLMGAGSGTRDFTFWGEEMMMVPIEEKSWTDVKSLFQ